MAQLLVRKIEDAVVRKLRLKAARNGVSSEEEHRRILRGALLKPKMNFKEFLLSMPDVGDDKVFLRRRSPARANKTLKKALLSLTGALDAKNLIRRAKDRPRKVAL